jgi:hypothetical protein
MTQFSTPSTTDEALTEQLGLPAGSSPQVIDATIMSNLTTKYGLAANATVEEVEAAMHKVRCERFGLDPATTSERELDAHVDERIAARKKAA